VVEEPHATVEGWRPNVLALGTYGLVNPQVLQYSA